MYRTVHTEARPPYYRPGTLLHLSVCWKMAATAESSADKVRVHNPELLAGLIDIEDTSTSSVRPHASTSTAGGSSGGFGRVARQEE